MQRTIMVPFHGDGAGTEELTWGQWTVWRMMNGFGAVFMVGGAMKLEEGTTLQHIEHLLAFVMRRHESLRTRIRTESDGTPRQVVSSSGEVGLEIVDIEDGEDPAAVAEALRERYEFEPFDIAEDWPVRMAVVRKDGVPDHFVAMYPHMAIDAYGFDALVGDLANLDRETGAELAERGGIQPRDLARKQRESSAQRQGQASLRYWERWLMEVPARRFNGPYTGSEQRWWDSTYDSRAAFLAVGAISARTGMHSGPVLLAAYAVALEKVTKAGPSAIRMVVSNRFRPDFARSVSVVAQPGLCVFDVRDCTFDEAVVRAWHAQIATGKNAYYDPRKLAELRERVEKERGEQLDLMLYFNDRRKTLAQPVAEPEAVADAEQMWDALPQSRLTWGIRSNAPDVKAYLDVNGSPDTVNLTLRSDTQALTPSEQVTVLRTMEEILLAAAFDPQCPTGV
ncbi:condensation domain protein [Catenulispora acidiphila DSM 44928]|uniref:Condensation domain protein n=1 Tax=Catenulispora acidiphila (strain DSM 44928 / JCM 14897 / NBRC 102108 / NRRL B-24433 / ID139908) TaxID=479433 RepID=C7Q6E5_CATAD|nr:condensation domain-containing protein [Catenulispora acidiphila]ACU72151.1 condensation domain protein [Catenulispora acidiphila DSM 44928]